MTTENHQPLLSVCVTTYQHARYIRECLESVLSQDLDGGMEILVGDDGSVDGTRAILDEIARNQPEIMRIFHHAKNLGPSANLRFLACRARGQYIAHLDGDDYWLPGKIAAQLAVMSQEADFSAAYCNAWVVDEHSQKIGVFNQNVPYRLNLHELLRRGNFLNHSSLLYRISARDAITGIDKAFIDYRLHIRLLRIGALAYIDQPLVGYRWRTSGSMIKTMSREVYEGHLDAFLEAAESGAERTDIGDAIGHFWGKLLVRSLIARQWSDLAQWALELLDKPQFGLTISALLIDSILAFPRAMMSWLRRRQRNAVYFP